jgi:hypothetical protein
MFQRILGKKAKHGTSPPVEPQQGGPEQNHAILKSVPVTYFHPEFFTLIDIGVEGHAGPSRSL